jgi:hypothetical protein
LADLVSLAFAGEELLQQHALLFADAPGPGTQAGQGTCPRLGYSRVPTLSSGAGYLPYNAFGKGGKIMPAEMTATVVNGVLKPDAALPFPDQTRVKLIIEPIKSNDAAWVAWQALLAKIDERPLVGLARKFSRDELHERD